jgi:hypothetical protein
VPGVFDTTFLKPPEEPGPENVAAPAAAPPAPTGPEAAPAFAPPALEPPLPPVPFPVLPAPAPPRGTTLWASVVIILLPYSIFMTAAAIYYYYQWKNTPSPLELLPDWPGDNPGATRKEQTSLVIERVPPDTPLPDKLRVALGGSLRVGDLEVTPEAVEERKVVFCSEAKGIQPEPSRAAALVLILRLKNCSRDTAFAPADPAFASRWEEGDPKPYTFLEIGPHRYYGGPLRWRPRAASTTFREPDPREYIRGQEACFRVLDPGEEVKLMLCSDPDNPAILQALHAQPGTVEWRVRLRRGLVWINDRAISTSAVIGVDFRAADVRPQPLAG